MSSYIRLSDSFYPLHQGDIRLEVDGIAEEFVCPEGYVLVQDTQLPEITNIQYIVEDAPVQQNDVWVKQFRVVDMTADEIALRAAALAEQEAQIFPHRQNLDSAGSAPNVVE
jgi:hypothetical protein